MNQIKDQLGRVIQEGDTVRYYDSTTMWLDGKIINIGSALAIETPENPIPLHTFVKGYVYDGTLIEELLVVCSNVTVNPDGEFNHSSRT